MRLYAKRPIGTVPRAGQLRREASEPECLLRRALQEAFPDHRWRYQVLLGPYITNILCLLERLVIEVDGDTHVHTPSRDAARDRFMAHEGYLILRVTNHDIMQNLEGTLTRISFFQRDREGVHTQRKGGTA